MSKFDDIIQQKANEHQAPVPAGAWDNIIKEKKKRRFIFFWWVFGILLCGLSIIGSYTYNNSGSHKVASIQKESTPVKTNISTEDKTTTPQAQPVVAAEKIDNKKEKETGSTTAAPDNKTTGSETASDQIKDPVSVATKIIPGDKSKNDHANVALKKDQKKKRNNKSGDKTTGTETAGNQIKDPVSVATKIIPGDKSKNDHANVVLKNDQKRNNKPGDKYATASLKSQMTTSAVKQNIHRKAAVKKEDSEESFAKRGKNIIKEKGNSKLKIQAGETEALAENKSKAKNSDEIAVTETKDATTKDADQPLIAPDAKDIATLPSSTKKDLVVDSVQAKQALTTPVENKNAQAVVNKPARKHSWFIDLGIAPVLPIQQYDRSTTFSRTQLSNNNLSVFSGKLVNTSIDPSVAFSLSVRRSMNKKLSLGLGLQYLQLKEHVTISGTEVNTKYTIVDRLVNNASGPQLVSDTVETITEGERKITAINSYTFFSIPLFVQYDLIQKKSWTLGMIGGAYVNVYGKYKNQINKNNDGQLIASTQANNQNSSVGIALYGGLRLGKQISKRLELFGTPSVTWALGRQNIKNSLLNKKIQQAGLNIGISYKLK